MEIINLVVGLAGLAFIAAGGLNLIKMGVLLVLGISALALGYKLRNKRKVALPVVLVLLAVMAWVSTIKVAGRADFQGGAYKQVGVKQMDATVKDCENAAKLLPDMVRVDGLVDEISAIDYQPLLSLLSQRKLQFIELRVSTRTAYGPVAAVGAHIVHSGNVGDHWLVDRPVGSYVKMAIGSTAASNCIAPDRLPEKLRNELDFSPLGEGACLTMVYADKPSARYALDYLADTPATKDKLGRYRLVDRQLNLTLAQLPTFEDPLRPADAGHRLLAKTETSLALLSCRNPHTMLLDRLVGTN
jgi:hypothetical protein